MSERIDLLLYNWLSSTCSRGFRDPSAAFSFTMFLASPMYTKFRRSCFRIDIWNIGVTGGFLNSSWLVVISTATKSFDMGKEKCVYNILRIDFRPLYMGWPKHVSIKFVGELNQTLRTICQGSTVNACIKHVVFGYKGFCGSFMCDRYITAAINALLCYLVLL